MLGTLPPWSPKRIQAWLDDDPSCPRTTRRPPRPPLARAGRGWHVSTRSRRTHRRDGDPVRVYADGRVAWWTGGRPGVGVRKTERKGAAADTFAEELRQLLRAGEGAAPRPDATLDEMAQAALDQMRRAGTPEGTVRQYKSNWELLGARRRGGHPVRRRPCAHLPTAAGPPLRQERPACGHLQGTRGRAGQG